MRLPSTIRSWIARAAGISPADWARGADLDSLTGGAALTDPYSQAAVVYACVQALGENVANLPLRVSRIDRPGARGGRRLRMAGEDIIGSGPLYDLLNQPHPQLSRFDFWELVVAWLHLRGQCFVVVLGPGNEVLRIHGRRPGERPSPIAMAILPTTAMSPIRSGRELLGYRYMPGIDAPMEPMNLLPEEVINIRLPALTNYTDGFAPAIVAQVAASADYAAGMFMRGLMLNNADTGMVVSTEQWLSDEQRAQVQSALRERKRKAGTADRPLILGGGLKLEKPDVSNVDLQYLESRNFNRRELCAVFRVPESILGFTEDANRSVGIEQRLNFLQFRIAPLCERLAQAISPLIRAFDPDMEAWFDLDASPVMQESRRLRFASARAAFDMGVTLKDLNELFDLGLPDYPWSGRAYIPFSLSPVDETPEASKPELPAPQLDDQGQNAFTGLAKALQAACTHQCGQHEEWVSSISGSVRKKRAILRRFFFEQRARVLEQLEALYGKAVAPGATRSVEDVFNSRAEDEALMRSLRPALLKDLEFGGAQLWRELGLTDDFRVAPAAAMEFMARRQNVIKDLNATTFQALKSSLNEGLSNGDTYQQLVQRVRDEYKAVTLGRAETIALTETNVAVNSGRYSGMEQAGVERKAWLASNLANSRPAHQQAGRDYESGIPIEQPFRVDGELLDFPGDPKGSPGNTINCKCTVLAVVDDKAVRPARMLSWEEWMSKAPGRLQDAPEARGVSGHHPAPENHFAKDWCVLQRGPVDGGANE